jgi:hypothetical protein
MLATRRFDRFPAQGRGLLSLQGMRDVDIRRVLRQQLNRSFKADDATMIIEELGLCRGSVRVDIAVVNGALKGYEIKSEKDTLTRLAAQAATYNRIFETMTVVVAERHLRATETLIPDWWGIQVATYHDSSSPITIDHIRDESPNPGVDPDLLVQLLWRDEVLDLLHQLNASKSLRRKPRLVLWEVLARTAPLPQLQDMVRSCLKSRPRWRVDEQRTQDGGMSQPGATLSDSPYQHVLPRSRRYTDRPS